MESTIGPGDNPQIEGDSESHDDISLGNLDHPKVYSRKNKRTNSN